MKQIEKQPDGGSLAGPVRADEPEYLPLQYLEV